MTIDQHSPANNYLAGAADTLQCGKELNFLWDKLPEKYYFWHSPDHPVSCEIFFPAVEVRPGMRTHMSSVMRKIIR